MRLLLIVIYLLSFGTLASINQPADTSSTLYAVGRGNDSKQAEKDALLRIAQKITATISVESKSLLKYSNGHSTEEFSEIARVSTENLPVYRYQIEKKHDGSPSEVLISIDTNELMNAYRQKLDSEIKKIRSAIEYAKNTLEIDAVVSVLSVKKELERAYTVLNALLALSNQDMSRYAEQIIPLITEANQQMSRINLKVISDSNNTDISDYVTKSIVRSGLSSEKGSQYQVLFSGKSQLAKKNGQFRIKRTIRVELRRVGETQSISVRNYNYISPVLDSKEQAELAVYEMALSEFGAEPILLILGV
jgi:hypothetical protein